MNSTLVPLLLLVPIFEYHSAPLAIITGTLAQVSTLFKLLGLSQSPLSTERIYFARGSPTLPSKEVIKAEDSPQTKAPPPLFIFMGNYSGSKFQGSRLENDAHRPV